jgi:hypothetical protein
VYSIQSVWPSLFRVWKADMLSEYAARPKATEASTLGLTHMSVAMLEDPSNTCAPTMSSGTTRLCTMKLRSRLSSMISRSCTALSWMPRARWTFATGFARAGAALRVLSRSLEESTPLRSW